MVCPWPCVFPTTILQLRTRILDVQRALVEAQIAAQSVNKDPSTWGDHVAKVELLKEELMEILSVARRRKSVAEGVSMDFEVRLILQHWKKGRAVRRDRWNYNVARLYSFRADHRLCDLGKNVLGNEEALYLEDHKAAWLETRADVHISQGSSYIRKHAQWKIWSKRLANKKQPQEFEDFRVGFWTKKLMQASAVVVEVNASRNLNSSLYRFSKASPCRCAAIKRTRTLMKFPLNVQGIILSQHDSRKKAGPKVKCSYIKLRRIAEGSLVVRDKDRICLALRGRGTSGVLTSLYWNKVEFFHPVLPISCLQMLNRFREILNTLRPGWALLYSPQRYEAAIQKFVIKLFHLIVLSEALWYFFSSGVKLDLIHPSKLSWQTLAAGYHEMSSTAG